MSDCVFQKGDVVGHPKVNNFGTIIDLLDGVPDKVRVEWEGTTTVDEDMAELYHFYPCHCDLA